MLFGKAGLGGFFCTKITIIIVRKRLASRFFFNLIIFFFLFRVFNISFVALHVKPTSVGVTVEGQAKGWMEKPIKNVFFYVYSFFANWPS